MWETLQHFCFKACNFLTYLFFLLLGELDHKSWSSVCVWILLGPNIFDNNSEKIRLTLLNFESSMLSMNSAPFLCQMVHSCHHQMYPRWIFSVHNMNRREIACAMLHDHESYGHGLVNQNRYGNRVNDLSACILPYITCDISDHKVCICGMEG